MRKDLKLVRTKYGFYQYDPKPSDKFLAHYYARRYYQTGQGSYEVSYTKEEKKYFRLKASLIYRQWSLLANLTGGQTVLDAGCGEGWLLNEFFRQGHPVLGLDYSEFALKKFHPQLLKYFEAGNFHDSLNRTIQERRKYDVVVLANVIEHVVSPEKLLSQIQKILAPPGWLIVVAPNDFSSLHRHLLSQKVIRKPFWLAYPDHLSYFSKESMEKFLAARGFPVKVVVAENPVDLNLLNVNSNYIEDPKKGKNIHFFRVRTDNFLAGIDPDKLLEVYRIFGSMGVGRDLVYFCPAKKS